MLNWKDLAVRYDQLNQELADIALDNARRLTVQKELARIAVLLAKHRQIEQLEKQMGEINQQANIVQDQELRELFESEAVALNDQLALHYQELEQLLYPPDELDVCSVFLEIRAGAGGQEAALFAADLMRMYTNYAIKKNWHASVASASQTDLKGYREVVLHIEGKGVYGHLKNESGVHRVQRVPQTETAGRIHTSTVTVAVLPEIADEAQIAINPSDLRIDVYRSGGAGGQHVNTTDSAVRITHIPTGVVVACQDERSQHKNKAKALKMLQGRLITAQREKQAQETSQKRKELIGTGMRAEKVRTYNFPQNRISDHQVNLTLNKLDFVMEGGIDEIIDALIKRDKELRKARGILDVSTWASDRT